MAKQVENVFVDVTGQDEQPFIDQHQKHFPGNVIARWEIDGRTYLKVPYADGETKAEGMDADAFKAISEPSHPIGNMSITGSEL